MQSDPLTAGERRTLSRKTKRDKEARKKEESREKEVAEEAGMARDNKKCGGREAEKQQQGRKRDGQANTEEE